MSPLNIAALVGAAFLVSAGSKRIFGVLLVVMGLLTVAGPLAPTYTVGYKSTTVQLDANTTQTTLTYVYQPYADPLTQALGLAMMLVGVYLVISAGVEDESIDVSELK